MKKPRLKIVERKLGRERAAGIMWLDDNILEIDPVFQGKEKFDTLIHELLHHVRPDFEEKEVVRITKIMVNALWTYGYRHTDLKKI